MAFYIVFRDRISDAKLWLFSIRTHLKQLETQKNLASMQAEGTLTQEIKTVCDLVEQP